MTNTIDCRNLQCPAPVLKTKEFLETAAVSELSVIVDNDAAVENVSRFLNSQGFEVTVDSDAASSTVSGTRNPEDAQVLETPSPRPASDTSENQKILVMVGSDKIGRGDDELGAKLMGNFIKTLKEMDRDLWRLVFVNFGVKLSTGASPVLEDLKTLEDSGVDILVCGACLTHLGLMDQKQVGQTTNMLDVVTSMQLADKVVNI